MLSINTWLLFSVIMSYHVCDTTIQKGNESDSIHYCLSSCQTIEDSLTCIQNEASRINNIINDRYIQVLKYREVSGMEEFGSVARVEVQQIISTWLTFKQKDLYFLCTHINDLHHLDLDTIFKQDQTFHWCQDYSNYGLRRCAKRSKVYYDSILTNTYHNILGIVDDNGKEQLKRAQEYWLEYVKAESSAYSKVSSSFSGSMYYTASLRNRERLYRQRALELRQYYFALVNN